MPMIARFCIYTTLKNLRFFDAFFVLYLVLELKLSYLAMGALVGYQKTLAGLLEVPLGAVTDRWGRRRALVASFLFNTAAFVTFALAVRSRRPILLLAIGQTLFGIGEALRSGTHKAMILDWLTQQDRRDESTRIIGITRFFSKSAAGISAAIAGLLVWWTDSFAPLFWAAAVPAMLGAVLIASYPKSLEGEWTRHKNDKGKNPPISWWSRARRLLAKPGIIPLIAASVLFESQFKLAMHYVQPYLVKSLGAHSLAVMGSVGAVIVGVYYLVQDLLAGVASFGGTWMQNRFGGTRGALAFAYITAVIIMAVATFCLWRGWLIPGLLVLMGFAWLQNARRAVFVTGLDQVMDPYQRATTLSLESQAKSWAFTLTALLAGGIADAKGLGGAFAVMTGLLILGLSIAILQRLKAV